MNEIENECDVDWMILILLAMMFNGTNDQEETEEKIGNEKGGTKNAE